MVVSEKVFQRSCDPDVRIDELVRFRREDGDFSGGEVIEPALEAELVGCDRFGDFRKSHQVAQLEPYIGLNQLRQPIGVGIGRVVVQGILRESDPLTNFWQTGHRFGIHEPLHGPALGMSADNDLRDFERFDGVLDRRGHPEIGFTLFADDVASVANDEQFARFAVGDQLGIYSRIAARNEERLGALTSGEFFKAALLFGERFVLKLANSS